VGVGGGGGAGLNVDLGEGVAEMPGNGLVAQEPVPTACAFGSGSPPVRWSPA